VKKNEKINCKYLGVGQDLIEFVKLPIPESLNIYIYIFINWGILKFLIRFIEKILTDG
jgi:hypothetical protein